MSLSDLLPTLHALPRSDKLQLIQLLAADMAREERAVADLADKTVPIWSPHDAFEGAATLLSALEEEKGA
jgi:hypothetical protein